MIGEQPSSRREALIAGMATATVLAVLPTLRVAAEAKESSSPAAEPTEERAP